jgi:hypothetical protein
MHPDIFPAAGAPGAIPGWPVRRLTGLFRGGSKGPFINDLRPHRFQASRIGLQTARRGCLSSGRYLACTLIALLPELGRMNRKQVAALVDLAPYAFDRAS